jgi:hypothetical protein
MKILERKQRVWPLRQEETRVANNAIARTTGLRSVDVKRLGIDEQHEIARLVQKSDRATNVTMLDKRERLRFEALTEKAGGAEGFFDSRRARAATTKELHDADVKRRRAPARPCWEEQGSVVLPRETAFEFLRDGIFHLEHIALLVTALGWLEAGDCTAPKSRIEGIGDDAVLVLDRTYGLGAIVDPEGRISGLWLQILEHIAANNWLRVEQHGGEVHVARGSRAITTTKGRSRK